MIRLVIHCSDVNRVLERSDSTMRSLQLLCSVLLLPGNRTHVQVHFPFAPAGASGHSLLWTDLQPLEICRTNQTGSSNTGRVWNDDCPSKKDKKKIASADVELSVYGCNLESIGLSEYNTSSQICLLSWKLRPPHIFSFRFWCRKKGLGAPFPRHSDASACGLIPARSLTRRYNWSEVYVIASGGIFLICCLRPL